jgi:AraC family transcriptional regulator, melibiose operon regulatory protein
VCTYSIYRKKSDPNFNFFEHDFHSHNEFEIYLFHRGDCNFLVNNLVYHLQPNDLLVMNGLILHRLHAIPSEVYERSVINFSSEVLQPIIHTIDIPDLLKPFYLHNNLLFRGLCKYELNQIEGLFKEIAALSQEKVSNKGDDKDSLNNARLDEAKIQLLLIQLLLQIYKLSQNHNSRNIHQESDKEQHVRRIISWIDEHFHEEVSLDDISSSLNLSKYYMSHIFKDITGGTIMKYLMSCRINRAKMLLESKPDLSVLDIAYESGFKHCSHFNRFFLKKVGTTPLAYRRRKI